MNYINDDCPQRRKEGEGDRYNEKRKREYKKMEVLIVIISLI